MAIKKIDTNKYRITIELGYDIFGNRKRKSVIFNGNKEDAIKKEADLKSELYHVGKTKNISDLTFEQLSQIFIEKYCVPNISKITTHGYINSLKRINQIIGKLKLSKITPLVLDNMYQKLSIGEEGQELGYYSKYAFYKVINVIYNQAIRWEIVDNNPNLKANKPKKVHTEKKFYDNEQIRKLLTALDEECVKYKTLILLALDSGARRSEICALRWSDIDFVNRTLNINKSLKVIDGVVDEKDVKSDSSNRQIVLSASTIEQLQEYKEWYDAYKLINKKRWIGKEDRVFTSNDGNHMHPCTCNKILAKVVKKHDLDHISFHELRHTCASLLINAGIDPKTVSKRLGHSDTSITMQIYTHSFETSKLECANKFDEMFKNVEAV